MHGVAGLVKDAKEEKALALFEEMEEYFAAYPAPNAKDVLFRLCKLKEGAKKEFYMPLLKKLLSYNISLDVKNWKGTTPFELCKESGKWDIYEKLNLSEMGESLKG